MLQERFLPQYHFVEKHSIAVCARPEKIFTLVDTLDFSESRIIRTLFALRGLGSMSKQKTDLLKMNFIELDKSENREMVLGLIGQFWKPDGNLKKVKPEQFREFAEDGFLKATWNFELSEQPENFTLVQTETRVLCLGNSAKRRFSFYWFFIRPFSGLIRMEMLKAIKRKAEQPNTPPF